MGEAMMEDLRPPFFPLRVLDLPIPPNRIHSLPPPFPLTITQAKVSRRRRRRRWERGGRGRMLDHYYEVTRARQSPRPALETLCKWLPLAAHAWLRAKAPCSPRSVPLPLTLSLFLPPRQSSSFQPLGGGQVHVRELRTSPCVRVAQLKGLRMRQRSAGTLTHTNYSLF